MRQTIGIVTHHYINNYGAFLQMDALINYLRINYPENNIKIINLVVLRHFIKDRRNLFIRRIRKQYFYNEIINWIKQIRLSIIYREERNKLERTRLITPVNRIQDHPFQAIILGSDEIWHHTDCSYSPIKFGLGLNAEKIIAYAPSVGGSYTTTNVKKEVCKGLNEINKLSARDYSTQRFIKAITGKTVPIVADPTLLDSNLATYYKENQEKYILCYQDESTDILKTKIREYARKRDLKIIGAGCYSDWYDHSIIDISPHKWSRLFEEAALVVTGTFHGTLYGIINRRKLIACPSRRHFNRIRKVQEFLSLIGGETFYFGPDVSITDDKINEMLHISNARYLDVFEKLNELQNRSYKFLAEALK